MPFFQTHRAASFFHHLPTFGRALLGGAVAVLWHFEAGELWFGLVLIPAVPMILACEGWALFLKMRGGLASTD